MFMVGAGFSEAVHTLLRLMHFDTRRLPVLFGLYRCDYHSGNTAQYPGKEYLLRQSKRGEAVLEK